MNEAQIIAITGLITGLGVLIKKSLPILNDLIKFIKDKRSERRLESTIEHYLYFLLHKYKANHVILFQPYTVDNPRYLFCDWEVHKPSIRSLKGLQMYIKDIESDYNKARNEFVISSRKDIECGSIRSVLLRESLSEVASISMYSQGKFVGFIIIGGNSKFGVNIEEDMREIAITLQDLI